MADLLDGRWTVKIDGDFVVFVIGAKIRNPLRARRALPLLGAMNTMLKQLERDGGAEGFLGYQRHGGPFGVIVQYWRSMEDLERFARRPDGRHAAVWRDWFRAAQHQNRSVSIWHESYFVPAGRYEAIYQNTAPIGLLKAGRPERIGRGTDTARERLGQAGVGQ